MTWPDPLRSPDGSIIATPEQWHARRAGLVDTLERCMYGPWPGTPAALDVRVLAAPHPVLGGLGTLRELQITTRAPDTVFSLLVITPARADPVLTFLGANFFGNHRVLDDPAITVSATPVGADGRRPHDGERGEETTAWDIEQTIRAGYGVATFCMSEVVPDDADRAAAPLARFAGQRGRTGAIAAWAWAFSRCLDVLGDLAEVRAERVVAVGHSRLGKAALWAAARDERLAGVIPSQSGVGGAAPSRTAPERAAIGSDGRPEAETVAEITRCFPHWFSTAYAAVAERVDDLPVDQHAVVALCAPRPVLLPNAADDLWADPIGQFDVLLAADPVYRLLGVTGLETDQMPHEGEASLGRLGYSLRPGGHAMAASDWPGWRSFADRWVRD